MEHLMGDLGLRGVRRGRAWRRATIGDETQEDLAANDAPSPAWQESTVVTAYYRTLALAGLTYIFPVGAVSATRNKAQCGF